MSYIAEFNSTDLNKIDTYLAMSNMKREFYINERTLRHILKETNIRFVLVGITRVQTTLLCELGLSYVQQSQRYVKMNNVINEKMANDQNGRILVGKSLDLYSKMTELKSTSKGRPKVDDFIHGITYEDARYILPLCIPANISVAMSGDKLVDLYTLFLEYGIIFKDLKEELDKYIPTAILGKLHAAAYNNLLDNSIHRDIYKDDFDKIPYNEILEIPGWGIKDSISSGAFTSTTEGNPVDKNNSLSIDERIQYIDRVMGYGHLGIAEQSRYNYGLAMSLTCYHQFIRHRLHNLVRETFNEFLNNKIEFYIPQSIKNSEFSEQYTKLVLDYIQYIHDKCKSGYDDSIMNYALNCFKIKVLVGTNARHDNWIFRERLCLTAQTEIRELMNIHYTHMKYSCPVVFKYGLPDCVYGKCKEGKLTCGKQEDVRRMYTE